MRRWWSGTSQLDPIGQMVRRFDGANDAWFTIVGVVANTATYSVRDSEPVAKMYFPLRTSITEGTPSAHTAGYVVRTTGAPLALPIDVTDMIVRQSSRTIAAGVALGLCGAAASTSALRNLLFGVAPRDIQTYVAVAIGLFFVALLACWLPARRAARVSPLESLHHG